MGEDRIKNMELIELLKSPHKKIVFLFGAGMSLALGDKAKTWIGWLQEGRKYLDVSDISVFDTSFDESSAKGLAKSAGILFRLLKMNGRYDSFMYDTIENLYPIKESLQKALVKLTRCGDFLVTTNYDSLLEKSVGMGAVTYDEPESILKILKDDMDHSVIHIHGIYTDNGKIDNIVANDEQYEAILNNPGAQFIQQLMGTYPIIMLGCGSTVSDPNLQGFLSFAKKYLRSDIPYFYVHKEGEDISGIPKNCTPVCYGAEYSDFPAFVEELASIRIQNKMDTGIGQFNPYKLEKQLATPHGRLHFMNLFASFVGRENEMGMLNEFLNESIGYAWWIVTGKGGIGKSRMVLEWVRSLPSDWYGVFVDSDKSDQIAEFRLFSNTVFIFDYIIGKEGQISSAVSELQKKVTRHKIRILFIERSLESSTRNWLDSIKSMLSQDDEIKFLRSGYSGDRTIPLMVSSLTLDKEKAYISDYLAKYLSECVDEGIKSKYDLHKEETIDAIESVFRADLQEEFWTPLYLSIFIELWIYHNGNPDIHTGEELLEKYIEKEEVRWKKVLGDDALVYGYAKALTIACVFDSYCISIPYGYKNSEIGGLDQYIRSKRSPGKKKTDWSQVFINEYGRDEVKNLPFVRRQRIVFKGLLDGKVFEEEDFVIPEYDEYFVIEPRYPDLIREFIVSYYLQVTEVEQFTKVIRWIDNGRLRMVSFLNHAIEDFPDEECFRKIIIKRPDNIHEHFMFMQTIIFINPIIWFKCLDDIKLILQNSRYTAYVETLNEVEIWGMLAECLIFIEDSERLLKFAMDFFDYLVARWNTLAISYMKPVILQYSMGFVLLDDLDSLMKYADTMDYFVESAPEYMLGDKFVLISKMYVHYNLSKMYFYRHDAKGFEHEFGIIRAICKLSTKEGNIRNLYFDVLDMQIDMWHHQREISQPEMLHEITMDIENIYADQKSERRAVVLSKSYGMDYEKYWSGKEGAQKKALNKLMRNVKQLLNTYPDNQDILISYIILLCNKIILCQYRYSIVSDEDWGLFERLSILRPDLLEIMLYYKEGLNYKMERTDPKSEEYFLWSFRFFDFGLRMSKTFKELEKDPEFTYPRKCPNKVDEKKKGKIFNEWLSIWKEGFTKNVLETSLYDPDVEKMCKKIVQTLDDREIKDLE